MHDAAITALLIWHKDSPLALAWAVIISLAFSEIPGKFHVLPEATFVIVPMEVPFLYTVIVAVFTAPETEDMVHVPLIV